MKNKASWLAEQASSFRISLEPGQIEKLLYFATMVFQKGTVSGLSGRKSLDEILEKDLLDSLLLVPYLEECQTLLDIGPGAGFPGIPIKIALPLISLTLLEAKEKAMKFLESVQKELDLKKTVLVRERAESLNRKKGFEDKFDVVVGRAVAPLKKFLPWGAPFLKKGGKLLLQKGKKWEEEYGGASREIKKFHMALESVDPGLEGEQKIIVFRRNWPQKMQHAKPTHQNRNDWSEPAFWIYR